jgi:hypothetical protein
MKPADIYPDLLNPLPVPIYLHSFEPLADKEWDRRERERKAYFNSRPIFSHGNSGLSCGFSSIRGGTAHLVDKEKIIKSFSHSMREIHKLTFFPTTEKETLLNELLEGCPFVINRYEEKSRHGDYFAYIWILDPNAMEGI